MDIEEAFQFIGPYGKHQYFLILLCWISNFLISTQMVLMVVVGATPDPSIPDERDLHTIVTDFGLYHEKWVVELMQSLFMAGYMVGCMLFGQLSDIYGRRTIVMPCLFFAGISGVCSGITNSWQMFAVTRFFAGFFIGGLTSGFTLMLELLSSKSWQFVGMVYQTFFSLGMMFLSGLAYTVLDWRTICFISGGFLFILFFSYALIIPESPRWLYTNGRINEAQMVVRSLAPSQQIANEIFLTSSKSNLTNGTEESTSQNTLIDIFRHRKLAIWLFANGTIWFASAVIYYGLTMGVSDLTPNIYLAVLLSAAVEIPGGLLCIYFMGTRKLGRKGTVISTFVICLVACIGMSIKPRGSPEWILGFGLTAKLAISASFNLLYVYSVEIFPTTLRNVGLGVSSTVGRIGAIIAPFVTLLETDEARLPYVIFSIICCVSIFATTILPRTYGYIIPQNIPDALNRKRIATSVSEITEDEECSLLGNQVP